jgi:hypothetical protein
MGRAATSRRTARLLQESHLLLQSPHVSPETAVAIMRNTKTAKKPDDPPCRCRLRIRRCHLRGRLHLHLRDGHRLRCRLRLRQVCHRRRQGVGPEGSRQPCSRQGLKMRANGGEGRPRGREKRPRTAEPQRRVRTVGCEAATRGGPHRCLDPATTTTAERTTIRRGPRNQLTSRELRKAIDTDKTKKAGDRREAHARAA